MRPVRMRRNRAGASQAPVPAVLTLLALGLAGGCAAEPPPATYARYEVFCYRTLADVGCFPRPEPGAAARFTGLAWSGPVRLLTRASELPERPRREAED